MNINYSELSSSRSLSVIAPAKINLHLEVLGFRKDGFHELAMLMQSINLFDEIDFLKTDNGEITLTSDDPNLSTGDDNLILKAAQLIQTCSSDKNVGAEIHLKKNIPIGAGLAGGSSDAAATLVGLNSLWGIGSSEKQLEKLGSELGSDVPFCLRGGTQFCFGRGESLEMIPEIKQSMAVVLVKDPLVEVSTPWAYSKFKEIYGNDYLKMEEDFEKRRQSLRDASWLNPLNCTNPPPLQNDLQKVIEPITPAVRNALEFLSSLEGVLSLAMSGSGPSCFGIFADLNGAQIALEENRNKLKLSGLDAWCCAFKSSGVSLRL
ncbi:MULTISPECIES: 4-(cytidine 5'-diphospho)-2-C-methyl-D-erythritol kinase [Prochlorococcus]|uniref:4-diphosphocytidyl-2-C-methyl-D-erythritol kinase n=1 Tax=Prochlorococcus marinus (strain SARG / CCMP1375 / SS120) TaxID=167539 RepID=ISPE_PROMA|nr:MULTISPECIES: 4-(cytidine 5'-diphospho)-2-C-methyl-D-erythritol kinase [Prochlorococcus]Q7VCH6.1 RecName: Full=4-diphosphocytidyl-2-C-methyl-D-erythritol kinase; Short=CMK; AltName: Full=4-(cytidine-5'-diphospho)-2-C-methyl-D-erythritol kinase [Prochlorococcus marinus subsp. marinus str. CCMP1375]AAP99808.1 4-diphosphocytidyl-2C-methyl-D-erythritol 2-phosphate synthase [Prochlorococcus marinus subsp. marinus str. CCMP1375]